MQVDSRGKAELERGCDVVLMRAAALPEALGAGEDLEDAALGGLGTAGNRGAIGDDLWLTAFGWTSSGRKAVRAQYTAKRAGDRCMGQASAGVIFKWTIGVTSDVSNRGRLLMANCHV